MHCEIVANNGPLNGFDTFARSIVEGEHCGGDYGVALDAGL